jgi:hypothetical protein
MSEPSSTINFPMWVMSYFRVEKVMSYFRVENKAGFGLK